MRHVKVVRGWSPTDGPKPYSEEWWMRLDIRNLLRRIGAANK